MMAKATKHKSLYERFQEEYLAVKEPCANRNGFRIRYVYYGTWYLWDRPVELLRKTKRTVLMEGCAAAAVWVLTAICPSALNRLPFVAFPAIASLCALLIALFGIGQFFFAGYRTTRSNFEDADRRIRLYVTLYLLSTAAAALGSVVYLLRYGFEIYGAAVLIGNAAQAVLAAKIRSQYRTIPTTTERNDTIYHVEPAMPE